MYGLPEDFDASVFVGTELSTVTYAVNAVHLAFGDDVSVTIATDFAYAVSAADEYEVESLPFGRPTALPSLIGRRVEAATAHSDGTLRLDLSDGGSITCRDASPMYESYTIRIGDSEVFV